MLWDACMLSPNYPVHAMEPAQKWHPSALSYHWSLQTAAWQMAAQISYRLGCVLPAVLPATDRCLLVGPVQEQEHCETKPRNV